ncbi:histidine kinase N-terminal 7TM domain-containing protein [uncultured Draconibacterium sp.]|uniref:histidine kinase N-terminal 7TM domain-containing protein n=1 Tax=uncultured Draconibacterium sp. TaxID=1573823 RepID=UPI003216BE65
MAESFSINGLIQFITAVAALLVIVLLWKFRKVNEVKFLMVLEMHVAIWAIFYALEFFAGDLATKTLWSQFSYFGIAFLPASYFLFTTAFSQKKKPINTRNKILISIIPLATILLVFSNQQHHLIWKEVNLSTEKNMLLYVHGHWFWVFYSYTFVLIISGLYNLFSSIYKFTSYYKSHILILIIASLIPVIANVIYVSKLNPFAGFDWTTVSFVLTGIVIAFGIYRYHMFELIPMAKKQLLDTMSAGVVVINLKGQLEDMNPAAEEIFGISFKECSNKTIEHIFKDFPKIPEAFYAKKDTTIHLETGKKKNVKYYLVKITSIYVRPSVLSGKLIVLNDITSIRQAEMRLKNSNKQLLQEVEKNEKLIEDLDSFAHTLAHDLKNSLGSIFSSSELVIELFEENNKELILDLLTMIRDSSRHTIDLTNELLKMATAGHQDVEKEAVDMAGTFLLAQKQLSETIAQKEAQITTPATWEPALGYSAWIVEVWINYLGNALKYAGDAPKIEVGCDKPKGNKVRFWIKDSGDGIPKDQQHKLFEKHVRLAPEKALGYGLGLSIVKRIVEKLDGTVGVKSTGLKGEGSLFYFTLPVK